MLIVLVNVSDAEREGVCVELMEVEELFDRDWLRDGEIVFVSELVKE
jgi:hypothetical protein